MISIATIPAVPAAPAAAAAAPTPSSKIRRSNDQAHLNAVSDVNELCPICKLVPAEANPNSHINLHHYRQINQNHAFVCEACDRRFPEKRLAKEHAYVAHGELTRVKQVYSCPVCALPYSQPIKVKEHILSAHFSSRPFKCGECAQGFATLTKQRKHEKEKHKGIAYKKWRRCDFCEFEGDTRVVQRHVISKHADMMIHCMLCKHKTMLRISMQRHMVKAHNRTDIIIP